MRSLIEPLAVGLLVVNALFLIGVIGRLAAAWPAWTAPVAVASAAAADPSVHLPLAGMSGFHGSPDVACLSLEGFLLDAGAALVAAGAAPPMEHAQIRALIDGGACAVDAPAVAAALQRYGAAWSAAGLAPVGPLQ